MSETFGQYGECECRLIMDKQRGTPKGIGFVEYGTVEEMKAAIGKYVLPTNLILFFYF